MSEVCQDGNLLRLGNNLVELAFDAATGALVSLLDKASGCELLRHAEAPRRLLRLGLLDAESRELSDLDSADARACTWEAAGGDGSASVTFRVSGFPGTAAVVEVRVTLSADSPLSAWRVKVSGVEAGVSVQQVVCPIISGLMKVGEGAGGECVVAPMHGEGFVFHDPYPVVDGLPLMTGLGPESPVVGSGQLRGYYPGLMSVQMLLYYNEQAGLYFATHDAGQHPKMFGVGPEGDYPALSVAHLASEAPGAEAAWEYDTMVGVFHGDWHDGADIYKAWAREQWWCERKLAERDLADWARTGFGVFQMSNYHIPQLRLNHSMDGIAETVNRVSAGAGVPLASLIFNFENGGGWSGPIGLLPPREGEDAFRDAMQKLREAGNHGFVYIPGGNWYIALSKYDPPFDSWAEFERDGRANAVKDVRGGAQIGTWYEGWQAAPLCPATQFVQQITVDMTLGCLALGCDVVQIDNFPCGGAAEPCFDPTHGHPLGHGPWRPEAWGEVLAETRRQAKAQYPDCLLTVEGMAECFIPWLDLYDMRAGNMEYFGHWGPGLPMGAETIPLFGYIYSGYIGAYLAAMPEGNRPEVQYWTLSLGRALTQGVIPSMGRYFPDPPGLNPTTEAFYGKVLRAARECWDAILFGEMLKPPCIDVPRVEASYLKFVLDGTRHHMDSMQRHVTTDWAVQHSAWRADDGSLVWIFANVSPEAVGFDLRLADVEEAAGGWDVVADTDGEKHEIAFGGEFPMCVRLEMEAHSVTTVRARKAG